jgi:hypothetical protein
LNLEAVSVSNFLFIGSLHMAYAQSGIGIKKQSPKKEK